MFSLQNLIAGESEIYGLLEESARQGQASIAALIDLLTARQRSLDSIAAARRNEKCAIQELRRHLVQTFVTPFDREDIELLSRALYRIPKTAEKCAERYLIADHLVREVDFSPKLPLLNRAGELLVQMVSDLHGSLDAARSKAANDELQRIEGEADKLLISSLRDIYQRDADGLRTLAAKDMFELLEKLFDRCRDAGNAVSLVVLKHA